MAGYPPGSSPNPGSQTASAAVSPLWAMTPRIFASVLSRSACLVLAVRDGSMKLAFAYKDFSDMSQAQKHFLQILKLKAPEDLHLAR